jgi:predicted Zn-dependent protease
MELLTKALCKQIIESGIAYGKTKTDGIEITISGMDDGATRWGQNQITQNLATESMEIAVRVLVGGRQVRLSSDHHLTSIRLKQLIDRAIDQARFNQKDPFAIDLPMPQAITAINHYDTATAKMGAAERGAIVAAVIKEAQAAKLTSAGFYSNAACIEAIGNSNGLFAYDRYTEAECSVTMLGDDSSGWAKSNMTAASQIDHLALVREAIATTQLGRNPVAIRPGRKTVILEPAAVLDLISFIWDDFSATSFIDQDSCFVDQLGKQILGSNITITDDVFHPLQWGTPFDGEGSPRQKLTIVENGVLKNLLVGRRSAKNLGMQATGHAAEQPSSVDEVAVNFVVAGGNTSLADMIASTNDGLLLKRVWYVRDVDPTTKLLTGMTRDGVFLIEGGKLTRAVKNLRFNTSVIEMLKNVVALGPAVAASGEESFPCVVPAMKVEGFNFSAGTVF